MVAFDLDGSLLHEGRLNDLAIAWQGRPPESVPIGPRVILVPRESAVPTLPGHSHPSGRASARRVRPRPAPASGRRHGCQAFHRSGRRVDPIPRPSWARSPAEDRWRAADRLIRPVRTSWEPGQGPRPATERVGPSEHARGTSRSPQRFRAELVGGVGTRLRRSVDPWPPRAPSAAPGRRSPGRCPRRSYRTPGRWGRSG